MSQYIESEKVELKVKYTDTICKEIVAFLNADGGQIVVGVDDAGEVVGVEKIDETLKRIALKNSNAITTIKANSTRNKLKNLEWVAQPQNLRREPTKKKKSKKKEPLWKRYRDC